MALADVIAEIGSIHDGSIGNAVQAVRCVAGCGATFAKFQLHISSAESTRDAPSPSYFSGESRVDYFNRLAFTEFQWRLLVDTCHEEGLKFMCSPFSLEAVDILESVGVDAYKVPSGEVTNIPLLERILETKKPVYLSSGMSNWEELDEAVRLLRFSAGGLTVLQCTSMYPCALENVGINVLGEMKSRYNLPVGLSDHTPGLVAPILAISLGAVVIEKHFTFSRSMYGSDARFGLEPAEFSSMCEMIYEAQQILASSVDKSDCSNFNDMKLVFEKSITLNRSLPAGHILTDADVSMKKPGGGIPGRDYKRVLGKTLKRSRDMDYQLSWTDLC